MPPNDKDAKINADVIAAHVKHLSDLNIAAVNHRDFSPNSPGWNFMAPNFTCNVLYDTNNIYGDPNCTDTLIDLDEHLARFRRLAEEFPEWQLRLVDQSASVDEQRGRVELFQTFENTGQPVGIVTRTVLMVRFVFWEGRWVCTRKRAVRGIGMREVGE